MCVVWRLLCILVGAPQWTSCTRPIARTLSFLPFCCYFNAYAYLAKSVMPIRTYSSRDKVVANCKDLYDEKFSNKPGTVQGASLYKKTHIGWADKFLIFTAICEQNKIETCGFMFLLKHSSLKITGLKKTQIGSFLRSGKSRLFKNSAYLFPNLH